MASQYVGGVIERVAGRFKAQRPGRMPRAEQAAVLQGLALRRQQLITKLELSSNTRHCFHHARVNAHECRGHGWRRSQGVTKRLAQLIVDGRGYHAVHLACFHRHAGGIDALGRAAWTVCDGRPRRNALVGGPTDLSVEAAVSWAPRADQPQVLPGSDASAPCRHFA